MAKKTSDTEIKTAKKSFLYRGNCINRVSIAGKEVAMIPGEVCELEYEAGQNGECINDYVSGLIIEGILIEPVKEEATEAIVE